MNPKFKIGDVVNSAFFKDIFTIYKIEITASEIRYLDHNGSTYSENSIALYTEPKPKVKKYLYAYRCNHMSNYATSSHFYKDIEEAEEALLSAIDIQRLDWSMIEVSE